MTQGFDERTPLQKRFAEVHAREIAPLLVPLESDHADLRLKTHKDLRLVLIAALALAVAALAYDKVLMPFALLGGAVVAALLVQRRQAFWERHVVEVIIPVFCKFLGGLQHEHAIRPYPFLEPFEEAGLIGRSTRRSLTHHFSGRYRETAFDLVDAALRQGSKSSNRKGGVDPVFDGLLFRIHVPRPVPVPITIVPVRGTPPVRQHPSELQKALRPVPVDDPAFEAKFLLRAAVTGTEAEDAVRAFASRDFRAALVAIHEAEGRLIPDRGGLSAAFVGDMFYLTLSRFEHHMIGPFRTERPRPFLRTRWFLHPDADFRATVHAMFDDVSLVHRIIDLLHDGEQPRAPGR